MTRTEFLDALEQELRRSGVSDTAEIVGEYEDHFAFRLADGFSEEEIAAKLGDPVSLAGQFAAIPAGGRSQGGRGWLAAIGLGFADLFVGCFSCCSRAPRYSVRSCRCLPPEKRSSGTHGAGSDMPAPDPDTHLWEVQNERGHNSYHRRDLGYRA